MRDPINKLFLLSIPAVKARNVVTLTVDGMFVNPESAVSRVSAADTNQPLFIGGHPKPDTVLGVVTTEGFVGCMRNVRIKRKPLRLGPEHVTGNIFLNICPSQ